MPKGAGGGPALWGTILNKPEELDDLSILNVSLNEYRSSENRTIAQLAENDFEDGLEALNYPDGFYDVFVDESKIASKNQVTVTTGSDGNVTIQSSNSSIDNNTTSSTDNDNFSFSFESEKNDLYISRIYVDGFGTDGFDVEIISNGETIYSESGDVRNDYFELLKSNYSSAIQSGESVTVNIVADFGNFDFYVDSAQNYSFDNTFISNLSGTLPSSNEITQEMVGLEQLGKSGSFTSTANNLGYQASKWTPTAKYTLNGQSLELELQDGSGNTIATATEAEIGNSIDISTTATSYQMEARLSGDGTDTPILEQYENGLDD